MTTKPNWHRYNKIFLFLLFTNLSINCIYSQASTMFLYETEQGYTYVDKDFKPLMNKTFKWAGRFFDGLAVASENGYVGYINSKGDFVIKPEFEYALPFHNGIAKVWQEGKPYLIDKTGKILFEHNYSFIKYAINNSFEPVFIVTTQRDKYGVIDKNGKIIIDTIYTEFRQFNEGLAIVQSFYQTDDKKKWSGYGVIDLQGNIIVPFGKYSQIGDYNSLRARVTSRDWDGKTIGFIDNKGNFVFNVENSYTYYDIDRFSFSAGLIVIPTMENRYKLFGVNGNELYESGDYIKLLGEGLFCTNYNILNTKGDTILKRANYDKAIRINGEIYFINSNGYIADMQDNTINSLNAENISIQNKNYFSTDYFIHKNLILVTERHGNYTVWHYGPYISGDPYRKPSFTFIDSKGFKDSLLYVVFYDRRYSDMVWGYVNEKREVVYKNKGENYFEKPTKPSINYKEERGAVIVLGENNKNIQKLNKSIQQDKLSFILTSSQFEKEFEYEMPPKRLCHKFSIINETKDTLLMKYCNVIVQVKDRKGNWREIHYTTPSDVITDYDMDDNAYQKLKPNEYIEYAIKAYDGGYKTKMRVCVKIPAIRIWDEESEKYSNITADKVFYSNEIDFEINASQFVRSGFTKDETESYPFEDYMFDRIRNIP